MPPTVKSLDERVGDLVSEVTDLGKEFAGFRSKMETSLALIRWVGIFSAGVVLTTILAVISVAHSAGKVESSVEQLRESSRELKTVVDEQNKLLREMARELSELRAKVK